MSYESGGGDQRVWPTSMSRLLELLAPIIAIFLTVFLILERTPRREPLLYGTLVAALLALTWLSAHTRGQYGHWALYVGAFATFSLIRSFADETGIPTHVEDLIAVEKTLAFGIVPTVWLQGQLFDPDHIGWIDRAATYVHWSYFVLPHLFAAHLFIRHRQLFERYVLLFVGVLMIGLIGYFLFPAAPPWVASLSGNLDPTYKVVTEVGSEFNTSFYARLDTQIRSSNPVAAMPSVHMAISVAVLLIAFRLNRPLGMIVLVYNAAMAFALVYAGEHYLVDVLAGVLAALGVYGALELWFRQRAGKTAAAPAPVGAAEIPGGPLGGPPTESGAQT